MQWDLFCRVIDNFGDIGVCWRLSADLAARGHTVRLWVDDASALRWMAPDLDWSDERGWQVGRRPGIEVHDWREAEGAPAPTPGDVVIEAFGCNPPDAFVGAMQRTHPPTWINLEYLSAEAYVERSHRLRSPVFSGPGAGLSKTFFYPGFTAATGGLPREPDLLTRQAAFQRDGALPWLHSLGIPAEAHDHLVSVFCYGGAPLPTWLDRLADGAASAAQVIPVAARAGRTRVLLTPGHATQLAQAWHAQASPARRARLVLHPLPALPQPAFDQLLWACHLNIVRGEDSAVRALWAGRPHIWHIYPQDDGVHADKLDAFMARWMAGWPPALRTAVQAAWRDFNGLAPATADALPEWRHPHSPWVQASLQARQQLLTQIDLVTQLTQFVTGSE